MNEVMNAEHFDRLISLYQWSFTIFITIIAIVITFMGIIQWRLSSKQLDKMKGDTKRELVKEYHLDGINSLKTRISKIDDRLNRVIENYSGNFNPFGAATAEDFFGRTIAQILVKAQFYNEGNSLPDNISISILDEIHRVLNLDQYENILTKDNMDDLRLIELLLDMRSSNDIKNNEKYKEFKERIKDFPMYSGIKDISN